MFKKIVLPLLAFIILLPQLSLAHSTLVEADPAQDATVSEEVTELTLTFNTKIEKGSSIELSKEGQPVDVATIQLNNDQLIASLGQPLDNGAYTVTWEIIGADGHPVSGEYTFTVESAATPPAEDNSTDEQTGQNNDGDAVNNEQESPEENADQTTDTENQTADASTEGSQTEEGFSNTLIAVIVILVLIALISFGWMVKRGKQ